MWIDANPTTYKQDFTWRLVHMVRCPYTSHVRRQGAVCKPRARYAVCVTVTITADLGGRHPESMQTHVLVVGWVLPPVSSPGIGGTAHMATGTARARLPAAPTGHGLMHAGLAGFSLQLWIEQESILLGSNWNQATLLGSNCCRVLLPTVTIRRFVSFPIHKRKQRKKRKKKQRQPQNTSATEEVWTLEFNLDFF